jgi:hypothetical protein
MKKKRRLIHVLFFAVLLAAGIFIGFMTLRTPAPVDGGDETAFSAVRAREVVAELASQPHSVLDTDAHERVYAAICARLKTLGLDPVTTVYPTPPESGADPANQLKNISAVIDGTSDNAVLLVAHYDSACGFDEDTWELTTGSSFGAADDGYGLATILETVRAVQAAGIPPVNDIMILITDAEEIGLCGAAAELRDNLDAYKNVLFVINLEARGVRGPAVMFETGGNNAAIVEYFAKYAKNPVSASFATAIYGVMPNDTDFSVFRHYGWSGLNFAVVDGLSYYHTADDNLNNIDLGSLQHYGDQVCSVVKGFAADAAVTPALLSSETSDLFFNILPGVLVTYGETVSVLLAAAAGALFIALSAAALVKRKMRPGKTLLYAALLLGSIVALSLLAEGFAYLLSVFYGEKFYLVYMPYVARAGLIYLCVIIAAAAFLGLFWRRRVKKKPGFELVFAGILMNLAVSVLLIVFLAGSAYITVLPALLSALYAFAADFLKKGALRHIVAAVTALLVMILYVPIVYLVFQALTIGALGVGVFLSLLAVSSVLPMFLTPLYPVGAAETRETDTALAEA